MYLKGLLRTNCQKCESRSERRVVFVSAVDCLLIHLSSSSQIPGDPDSAVVHPSLKEVRLYLACLSGTPSSE